ncbi:MAG TPA: hypothetical protein VKN74_02830 [Candidatus Mcinerneyibacterium sp.]|nr:hypothetical protein [Candidatus Mcinerneyibacterium sp.]
MNIKELNIRIHAKDSNTLSKFLIDFMQIINQNLIYEYTSKDSSIQRINKIKTNKGIETYEKWKTESKNKISE